MHWTETKLSKRTDVTSYFQISCRVSYMKTSRVLGHDKIFARRSNPVQCLRKTLKAFYAGQPPIIQWVRIFQLFVCLLFLSGCSPFQPPEWRVVQKRLSYFFFTYSLTTHRDDSHKRSRAALSLVQSPFPVNLQSISKPSELGRKNGIVKLSTYFIMEELNVISNHIFCHLF